MYGLTSRSASTRHGGSTNSSAEALRRSVALHQHRRSISKYSLTRPHQCTRPLPTSHVRTRKTQLPFPPGAPLTLDQRHRRSEVYISLDYQMDRDRDILRYGHIAKDPTDEYPQKLERGGTSCGPTKGLYIFLLQSRIVSLSTTCCKNVLKEIFSHSLLNTEYVVFSVSSLVVASKDAYIGFTTAARLVPYRTRTLPNFSRLRNHVTTLLETSQDHT
jgi:hypothetical protein